MTTTIAQFDNTYQRTLDGGFYAPWKPAQVPKARLVWFNEDLSAQLGLQVDPASPQAAQVFAGNEVPEGASPIAQAYAGHQFGGFSPQLGDGRALLLGEVIDTAGQRRDIAFKGSGRTPFSRGGDGKAAIGAVLREVLIGEAMHALGIPTTRALAAATTGERIRRDVGAAGGWAPGAVLTRVAASHLRVGTFEFFAAREDHERLKRLADYAIARHDSDLIDAPDRYLQLIARVAARQARLIAQWMGVGFIHGVMNTDNMTISGETIDYGPCAFMEAYDPSIVFSSIDHQGRYAFGNQPGIAQWNLARLAQALLPLLHDDAEQAVALVSPLLEAFADQVTDERVKVTAGKLGLQSLNPTQDPSLMQALMDLIRAKRADHTLAFRKLGGVAQGHDAPWLALFGEDPKAHDWLASLKARWATDGTLPEQRLATLRQANPMVIPRNHRVEEALDAATQSDDFVPFERLLASLKRPHDDRDAEDPDAMPASQAQTASYRTYCGT